MEEDICNRTVVKMKNDDGQNEVDEPKNLKPAASGLFGEGMDGRDRQADDLDRGHDSNR